MGQMRDEDLKVLSGSSFSREPEAEAPRPSVTRTPPRVWPQVSQADMGRVVRRLRSASVPVHEQEPLGRWVGKTG